jgi:hypothetical protein
VDTTHLVTRGTALGARHLCPRPRTLPSSLGCKCLPPRLCHTLRNKTLDLHSFVPMLGGCPEFGRLEPLVSTLVSKTQIELRANFLELVMVPFPELDLEPGSKHKV